MNRLNVGIIGTGGVGYRLCKGIKDFPFVKLHSICEINDQKRKIICEEFNIKGYSDYREFLENREIDVVYVGTPNYLHAKISIDALKKGKYVFCEKPLGLNREEIKEVIKAEKESGRYLQVDFEMRYSKMSKRIKDIIDNGEIGEVKNIYFIHCPGGSGFKKKEGDWRAEPMKVGGYYFEEGCHRLDIFRYWMNEEIEKVEAIPAPSLRGDNGWHRGYKEPVVTICFFPKGKIATLLTLQHRGVSNVLEPNMEQKLGHEYSASIMASEGSIRADFWERYIQIFRFEGENGYTNLDRTESYVGIPHYKLHHDSIGFFKDFCLRIIKGEKPFVEAYDSARTMAVVIACEESFKNHGKRIKVDYNFLDV
ncbi:MAG: Gfo/Idh/MocA family oxidoreductase [Candidatus Omnitrophica bacterium]|nr:Gfo/Idh/MocA family oxidoreductase [Candidatus Omnitrophota bacterium]